MRINVNSSMSLSKAMMHVTNFLCENYPNSFLAGSLNLYVSLRDDENHLSPDDEGVFLVEADKVINLIEEKKKEALEETKRLWSLYCMTYRKQRLLKQIALEDTEKYLKRSTSKKYSAATIEKLQKRHLEFTEELQNLNEMCDFLDELNGYVLSEQVEIKISEKTKCQSDYKAFIIFQKTSRGPKCFIGNPHSPNSGQLQDL